MGYFIHNRFNYIYLNTDSLDNVMFDVFITNIKTGKNSNDD